MRRIVAALVGLSTLGAGTVGATTPPPLTEDEAVVAFVAFVGAENFLHVTCGQAFPDDPSSFACYGVDYGDNDSATEGDVRIVFAILGRHVETGEIVFSAVHGPPWGDEIYEYPSAATAQASTPTTIVGAPTTAAVGPVSTTFSDGRWLVPEEVGYGTYQLTGEGCDGGITSYSDITAEDINTIDVISGPGSYFFEIREGDALVEVHEFAGDCTWTLGP